LFGNPDFDMNSFFFFFVFSKFCSHEENESMILKIFQRSTQQNGLKVNYVSHIKFNISK
jgi:hypothetical protein